MLTECLATDAHEVKKKLKGEIAYKTPVLGRMLKGKTIQRKNLEIEKEK